MNKDSFNNAVITGKRVLRNVGQATSDVAQNLQIRYKIADLNAQVRLKYRKLGKLACDAMDVGSLAMDETMQNVYNEINDLKERIAALKEDL